MADETNRSLITEIRQWPLTRKLSLAAVLVLTVAVFAIIILQGTKADYRLLYANLGEGDASAVVNWLKEQKIPYQIKDNGKAVYIPAGQVYEARLQLAGIGVPKGGGVGFEIFDKQSFGVTDFTQKVNYQRALQGELARTISSLGPVENARVMLALPEKRLFKEQQKETTASVILKLTPGGHLNENQIQGVVHLVAGSIEGLNAGNVNVIDSSGNILTQNSAQGMPGPMTPGKLDYQQRLESSLEQRAQSLLDRALGPGNSLARVTASLDFSQKEKTEEIYDPDTIVPRSEQISEEKSGNAVSGGIPGVESNLKENNSPSVNDVNSSSRSTETINYEISKVINRVVDPVGTIKNLSVAVLVADRLVPGEEGEEPAYAPRTEQELSSIESMIRSALGIDAGRGDQLQVVSMPFETELYARALPETPPETSYYEYLPYVKYGLLALGAALFYLLLVRPMLKTLLGASPQPGRYMTVEELEGELSEHEQLPAPSDPTQKVRQRILKSETSPTQVIRSWLNQE